MIMRKLKRQYKESYEGLDTNDLMDKIDDVESALWNTKSPLYNTFEDIIFKNNASEDDSSYKGYFSTMSDSDIRNCYDELRAEIINARKDGWDIPSRVLNALSITESKRRTTTRRYFKESVDNSISVDISGLEVEVDKDLDTEIMFHNGTLRSHIVYGKGIINSYEDEGQENILCYIDFALAEILCDYVAENYPDVALGDGAKHGYLSFNSGTVTLDIPNDVLDEASESEDLFYDEGISNIDYKLSGIRLSSAVVSDDWQYDRKSSYVTYEY